MWSNFFKNNLKLHVSLKRVLISSLRKTSENKVKFKETNFFKRYEYFFFIFYLNFFFDLLSYTVQDNLYKNVEF